MDREPNVQGNKRLAPTRLGLTSIHEAGCQVKLSTDAFSTNCVSRERSYFTRASRSVRASVVCGEFHCIICTDPARLDD